MRRPIPMPQIGESVVEGTVTRWLKQPGDPVAKLEPLLEINTDKIDTEVPAPTDGILAEVLVEEGQTVATGTVLAYLDVGESKDGDGPAPQASESIQQAGAAKADASMSQRGYPSDGKKGRAFLSPVVRKLAREHQIDLEDVSGSGMGGRITKNDVLAYLERRSQNDAVAEEQAEQPATLREDEVWAPLTTMRRAIAQHTVASKRTSAHVTTVFEVDMTSVVRHREANRAAYAERGLRLTFTPYFVEAAARALHAVPEANARFQDRDSVEGLVFNKRVHIGVAVSVDGGLLVPVIRDADEKCLPGLVRAVNDLAQKARDGGLAVDAAQGGTFTITNHGVGGSLLATPIIHQPQAGILGVGAIVKRPVVRPGGKSLLPDADDAIVIRPMCYLSFSFDHRILDGARADVFVATVKERLEGWPLEAVGLHAG